MIRLGPNGRLLLIGGKPVKAIPGSVPAGGETPAGGTLSIALVPVYMGNTRARINVQTSAASGDTTADVPFLFTYTGDAPAVVQGRAIDAAGNAVPGADWIALEDLAIDAAAKTGLGYLPGVREGAEYRREVRAGTSATVKHTETQQFAVGQNLLPWGQSNQTGSLRAGGSFSDAVPGANPARTELTYWVNENAGAYWGDEGFVAPGGISGQSGSISMGSDSIPAAAGNLALSRIVGDRLKAKRGRKVGVCLNSWANDGTVISQYLPGGNLNLTGKNGTTTGTMGMSSPLNYWTGDFRSVEWLQGETESASLTRLQRRDQLIALCEMLHAHVAQFGRSPAQLTIMFAVLGVYASVTNAEALRGAIYDVIAYGKARGWDVRISRSNIDLDPVVSGDGLHFGGDDQRKANRRQIQSFLNAVDPVGVPFSGEGPHLTGAYTRSGDDITLTVAHNGGTALAAKNPAAAITGWYANTNFSDAAGVDIALSNVTIVSPTQVRVTATGAPAAFEIKHCGHKLKSALSYHPDVSNLIYDDFTYPTGAHAGDQYTGRPLHETPTAIRIG